MTENNRHGIRMGTSELYPRGGGPGPRVLHAAVRSAARRRGAGRRAARHTLRARIREALSSRHVPNEIVAPGAARTLSGKKMEVPIKKLLLGHAPQSIANRDAMANPER